MALGGETRDGLLAKLQVEFQGERVGATRRAEDKLRHELTQLQCLADELRISQSAPSSTSLGAHEQRAREDAFNKKRGVALKLRGELIVQREVCGIVTNTANGVEREFPIPSL